MTPKVFFREVKASEYRSEDRLREATTQAWQTVRIYAEAKGSKSGFPSLRKFLDEIGSASTQRSSSQSAVEMKAMLNMFAAEHKLRIREVAN
jgi:hypothetical protein